MSKKRTNTDSSDFERMYSSFVEGTYDQQFEQMVETSPFKDKSYEDDEVDLTNEDYLDADINPYTYQGGLDLEADDPFNEIRAVKQGGWSEAGAGLGRTASKIGREVLKTAGAVGGAAIGLAGQYDDLMSGEDNTDFLSTTFNNGFIKGVDSTFDDFNKANLPVYVKDAVTNGDFWDKVTSGEFYATEGADGLGYMISAMAPGAAFKALGAGNKIFKGVLGLNKIRFGGNINKARRAMGALTLDKIDNIVIPAANTFFEAGAEGKGVEDTLNRPENVEKYYAQNQGSEKHQQATINKLKELDSQRKSGEINIDQYNALSASASQDALEDMRKEDVSSAVLNTVLKNAAILAGPNYIQAKIMYGKNAAKNLSKKVTAQVAPTTEAGGKSFGKFAKDAFKAIPESVVGKGGRRVGESFIAEGGEEVAQSAVEHRNIEEALAGRIGDSVVDDYALNTFTNDFVKTLSTTEGQVAGFLGGIMASPISVYQGAKQDIKGKVKEDKLINKIRSAGSSLNDLHLPLFQTRAVKDANGNDMEEIVMDENGPVQNKENIIKVGKAIKHHEELSRLYDAAILQGDVDTVDDIVKKAEHDLIMNFINEDEVSLDALSQHLDATMPSSTEDESNNKANKIRRNSIIDKAKYLQQELNSFKDMSSNLIKIDKKNATDDQVDNFLEDMGKEFLSETSRSYDLNQKLEKLNQLKNKLDKESKVVEVENLAYIEGVSHELDKTVTTRQNPRLNLIQRQINAIKNELETIDENINNNTWDNDLVNKAFLRKTKQEKEIAANLDPEKVKANNAKLVKVKSAKTREELSKIDHQNDPVIKAAIAKKNDEILAKEKATRNTKQTQEAEEEVLGNQVDEEMGSWLSQVGKETAEEEVPEQEEQPAFEEETTTEETTRTIEGPEKTKDQIEEENILAEKELDAKINHFINHHEESLEQYTKELKEEQSKNIIKRNPFTVRELKDQVAYDQKSLDQLNSDPIIYFQGWLQDRIDQEKEWLKDKKYKKEQMDKYGSTDLEVTDAYFVKNIKETIAQLEKRKKAKAKQPKGKKVSHPITEEPITIIADGKEAIKIADSTGEIQQLPKRKEEPGDGTSSEVPINDPNPVTNGTTQNDAKTPGVAHNNPAYTNYLLDSRDKTGDEVTFSLNLGGLVIKKDGTAETGNPAAEAYNIYKRLKDSNSFDKMTVYERDTLINALPIFFNYAGRAKSWSAYPRNKTGGTYLLREAIVNALAEGNSLESISTSVSNQESADFNSKLEADGKTPVRNNVLELYDFTDVNPNDITNQLPLYHINSIGEPIRISKTSGEFNFTNGKVKPELSGEIFVLLKSPKGHNAPAKLNTNKLNSKQAIGLAAVYAELLKDPELRTTVLAAKTDPEIQRVLKDFLSNEINALGGKPGAITFGQLIELMVLEDSGFERDIVVTPAGDFMANVQFMGIQYPLDTKASIGEFAKALTENKKQNVITITDPKKTSIPKINFQNNTYLNYLFQNKIVSTDIATGGERSFVQATTGGKTGSEVWLKSSVNATAKTKATATGTTVQEIPKVAEPTLSEKLAAIDTTALAESLKTVEKPRDIDAEIVALEDRRDKELAKVKGLGNARKGDKGIYYTNLKGKRQDWEVDKNVTIESISKFGVKFEGDKDWKNFKEGWHNFTNTTRENEINKRFNPAIDKLRKEKTAFGPTIKTEIPADVQAAFNKLPSRVYTELEKQIIALQKAKEDALANINFDTMKVGESLQEARDKIRAEYDAQIDDLQKTEPEEGTIASLSDEQIQEIKTRINSDPRMRNPIEVLTREVFQEIEDSQSGRETAEILEKYNPERSFTRGSYGINTLTDIIDDAFYNVFHPDPLREQMEKYKREEELDKLNSISSSIAATRLEPTQFRITKIAEDLNIDMPKEGSKGIKFLRQLSLSGGVEYENIQEWLDKAETVITGRINSEKKRLGYAPERVEKVMDDSPVQVGKFIVASAPFNKGTTSGTIVAMKPNAARKGAYSLDLDNGERVAWTEATNSFTWVQKSPEEIRISQEKAVSLSDVKIENEMNTPTTEDNIDYKAELNKITVESNLKATADEYLNKMEQIDAILINSSIIPQNLLENFQKDRVNLESEIDKFLIDNKLIKKC